MSVMAVVFSVRLRRLSNGERTDRWVSDVSKDEKQWQSARQPNKLPFQPHLDSHGKEDIVRDLVEVYYTDYT